MYSYIIPAKMKNLVIEHIRKLNREREEKHAFPPDPNEFQVVQSICESCRNELNSLIDEGCVEVEGFNFNKHRILRVKQETT